MQATNNRGIHLQVKNTIDNQSASGFTGQLEWKCDITSFGVIHPFCDLTTIEQYTSFSSCFIAVHKTIDEVPWLAFLLLQEEEKVIELSTVK